MQRLLPSVFKSVLGCALAVLLMVPATQAQSAASNSPFGECPDPSADRNQKLTKYSLYYENYKNDDFEAAMPHLRWILQCAPAFGGSSDEPSAKNLRRAYQAYEGLAESASGDDQRAYLDSALMVIETAPGVLADSEAEVDEFAWTFRRGYFIQQHSEVLSDRQDEAFQAFREAYELDPEQLASRHETYYFNRILNGYSEAGNTAEMLQFVNDLESRFGDSDAVIDLIGEYMDEVPTDDRIAYLERRLESNPDNTEVVEQLFTLYQEEGMRDKLYGLGEEMLEDNPTPELYSILADMYREDGEYQQAVEYYQQMMDMPGAEPGAEDYYNLGLAQQDLGRLSSARASFREALQVDPNYGRAHMAIGDLYAAAVQECMSGQLEREDRAVYWLAVDKYQRAKSVDSGIASRADQKISTYRRYFPSQEDLFFWEKSPGDSYQVNSGCYSWISENTTVRNAS